VGSRAAARKPRQAGGSVTTSSFLPLLAGSDLQNTRKTQQANCFNLLSWFSGLPLSLFL